MNDRIIIDGAHGEGGGQIIRTGLSLSALTGKPIEVVNVRANRSRPGLQAQHLAAVRAAASLCGASLEGAAIGSTRFLFEPDSLPASGVYRIEVGTAGAAALVAQTLLVPLAMQPSESRITVVGGTHVPHAPTADYLARVYGPVLARAGINASVQFRRAGFFPKGGGELEIVTGSSGSGPEIRPLDFRERGDLVRLTARVVTSNLPDHVAERGADAITHFMRGVGRTAIIEVERPSGLDAGAAILISAECESGFGGFSALGERGKPMERVAQDACQAFMKWWKSGAGCDDHLADQLVLPMALAGGESHWSVAEVSDHLKTVVWLAAKFLPISWTFIESPKGGFQVSVKTEAV